MNIHIKITFTHLDRLDTQKTPETSDLLRLLKQDKISHKRPEISQISVVISVGQNWVRCTNNDLT